MRLSSEEIKASYQAKINDLLENPLPDPKEQFKNQEIVICEGEERYPLERTAFEELTTQLYKYALHARVEGAPEMPSQGLVAFMPNFTVDFGRELGIKISWTLLENDDGEVILGVKDDFGIVGSFKRTTDQEWRGRLQIEGHEVRANLTSLDWGTLAPLTREFWELWAKSLPQAHHLPDDFKTLERTAFEELTTHQLYEYILHAPPELVPEMPTQGVVAIMPNFTVDFGKETDFKISWTLLENDEGEVILGVQDEFEILGLFKQTTDQEWQGRLQIEEHEIRADLTPLNKKARNYWDRGIMKSVILYDEYDIALEEFDPADIIIDVGGHIGSFSYLCHRHGSRNIYCYEAESENYRVLTAFLEDLEGIHKFNLAVFRSDEPLTYSLTHSGYGENTGGGNVLSTVAIVKRIKQQKPQEVKVVGLDEILSQFERVKLLKLDCEGSEFPILLTSQLLHKVERIVGEYHEIDAAMMASLNPKAKVNNLATYRVDILVECLRSFGFEVKTFYTDKSVGLGKFDARRPVK